ncbi:MAG TPA: hypothetical protein VFE35_05345 [Candidatus Cybelea sp.]|jgi:hypothetical protein|nr:hypothetical protein [Candidatus Cybelea sp.]
MFDAPASNTRPRSHARNRGHRSIVRIARLLARFVRHEPVRYDLYEKRFGGSAASFRFDVTAIRSARICRGAERLGSADPS